MNVAQLKPNHGDALRPGCCLFPRSYERGSIEACVLISPLLRIHEFPRSYERGSIEAPRSKTDFPNPRAGFPRSYERGSIEAQTRAPW